MKRGVDAGNPTIRFGTLPTPRPSLAPKGASVMATDA